MIRILLIGFFLVSVAYSQTYMASYPEKSRNALEHLEIYKSSYTETFEKFHCPSDFLLAIVLPEVSRYNSIQDAGETAASEVFYTQMGSDYGNFSIGYFQMKPSFVEWMEEKVRKEQSLDEFIEITRFKSSDNKLRSERLRRIKSTYWSAVYLCCFYKIIEQKFTHLNFASTTQKLAFFATAYNRGPDSSEKEIRKWMNIAYFPNSGKTGDFIYKDVTIEFYNYLKNEIN